MTTGNDFQLTPPPIAADDPAYVEQGVSVFSVDDGYSWYAARNKREAMEAALKDWGGEAEEYWPEGESEVEACDLDDNTVNISEDEDPKGPVITYREHLRRELAAGVEVPFFFCGSDQ